MAFKSSFKQFQFLCQLLFKLWSYRTYASLHQLRQTCRKKGSDSPTAKRMALGVMPVSQILWHAKEPSLLNDP